MNLFKIHKRLEEEKNKEIQKKMAGVFSKIQDVLNAENCVILTLLEYTPAGVFPKWTIVEKPKEEELKKENGQK